MLIWMNVRARDLTPISDKFLFFISIVYYLCLFIPQVVLGTEVRHIIDGLLVTEIARPNMGESPK